MNVALPRALPWRRLSWREREHLAKSSSKKRFFVYALLWLIAAVLFAGGLLQTSLFRIDRIDVTGNSQLSRDDILSLTKLQTGHSIAVVNSQTVEDRLEKHPWVLHARVQTHWPHVVSVSIVEQRAVAVTQTKSKKWALLGPDGTVLSISDNPVSKLPAVLGAAAPDQVGALIDASASHLMEVASAMPVSLAPRVIQMQETDNVIRLGLDAGTVVLIGDANDIDQKLMSAATVISHTDPKTLAELDVSSPRFPVARPRNQVATTTTQVGQKSTQTTAKSTQSTSKTTQTTQKKSTTTTSH